MSHRAIALLYSDLVSSRAGQEFFDKIFFGQKMPSGRSQAFCSKVSVLTRKLLESRMVLVAKERKKDRSTPEQPVARG